MAVFPYFMYWKCPYVESGWFKKGQNSITYVLNKDGPLGWIETILTYIFISYLSMFYKQQMNNESFSNFDSVA